MDRVTDTAAAGGTWTSPGSPPSRSVAQLVADGTLDAQLAAVVWLMLEGHVPLVIGAGPRLVGKSTLLHALLDLLPPDIGTRQIRGRREDFSWLPDPLALGWPGADVADLAGGVRAGGLGGRERAPGSGTIAPPEQTYLLCAELSDHTPFYTWGLRARVLVRSLQLGYGLGATIHAEGLRDVFEALMPPPVDLTEDEIRRLGLILILRRLSVGDRDVPGVDDEGTIRRVVAAHYLRPAERDGEGHVQRRPPITLASWDGERDAFDHYEWGATPELAMRVGRNQAELEREMALRRAFLAEVVAAGRLSVPAFRAALATYRGGGSAHTHQHAPADG